MSKFGLKKRVSLGNVLSKSLLDCNSIRLGSSVGQLEGLGSDFIWLLRMTLRHRPNILAMS